MAKYHINPASGEVGSCRAQHACPFGGADAHHESPALARAAFEAQQSGSFAPPPPHELALTKARLEAMDKCGRELAGLFSADDVFDFPEEQDCWWEADGAGEETLHYEQVQVGDFRLLASGAAVNAYLHEPSSTVYKIPHFEGVGEGWTSSVSSMLMEIGEGERRSYERLNHDVLAAHSVTYVPTHYFSVPTPQGPLPLMAQAYLDPDQYEAHDMSGTEQNRMAAELGVWDLNKGNVRRHKTTGQLVLLDCVPAWQ